MKKTMKKKSDTDQPDPYIPAGSAGLHHDRKRASS